MSDSIAVDLLFGGMDKLGPGSDTDTLRVFEMLPAREWQLVVDAGSGAGRQTLALAQRLQTKIHAVDSHEPFLAALRERTRAEGIAQLIETHCFDMADIPARFREIDLLWSEGAAYSIGFPHALQTWQPALRSGGFAIVSELSWLRDDPPSEVRRFFEHGYPDMRNVEANRSVAEAAGYEVIATHVVPPDAWVDGYYDILEPRARALLDHADESVRAFAAEMVEEIRIFEISEETYGYVFYLLRNR
ncbi:MAG TPA: class I SAM-dependent methyltransferase [Planctomycetota bacterium]|nr:class I SAM-dependent methyltransferase [Planctomycetota bacterium]